MKKEELQTNQRFSVAIQRLGIYGEGVGSYDGLTVFIDGALPGEVVKAEVTEKKKRYARAKLIAVEKSSPSRVLPPCSVFGKCGGCQLMHLDYASQLEMKRERVIDAFERIGKFKDVFVYPCTPSPLPLGYRNKIQVPIRKGMQIGFNVRNTNDLVDVEFCSIHCDLGQKVYAEVRRLLKEFAQSPGLTVYDPETGEGELRYLIIKSAVKTKEVLVLFVTSKKASPSLRTVAEEIKKRCPEVKSVVQNINAVPNNVVLGDQFFQLSGSSCIEEEILGRKFKVSPASFFQVNPFQAENLYRKIADFAALTKEETVLDAYCGVGTLSLILSSDAKKAIGVECVSQAVDDACENALKNGVENASFICGNAEEVIQRMESLDVVVLNPPRKGVDPSLLKRLGKILPKRVVYVSCDPATLARDLAVIRELGYLISQVQPFDMFPQTAHVETAVLCQKM